MTPLRFAFHGHPDIADDPPVAEAMLHHRVLLAAGCGEIELGPDWRLAEVTCEVVTSRFSDERIALVTSVVLGARKPGATASDI